MVVHPAKAHNAVGALCDMYGEALTVVLNENEQLRAALAQKEKELERANEIVRSAKGVNVRHHARVAELESALRAAREGALPPTDDRPGDADAERPEGGGGVHGVQGELADVVLDGERPEPHPEVREGPPPPRPPDAGAEGEREPHRPWAGWPDKPEDSSEAV